MNQKLSVILLTYNNWELTMKRLAELYAKMPPESELVWVDNGSREEDAVANMQWWIDNIPKKLSLKFYKFSENAGFGRGNNKGAEISTGENLLFLSNDVLIHRPFYTPILEKLALCPNTVLGGRVIYWDAGWNQIIDASGKSRTFPYCEGWALSLSREMWNTIGGFDPIFFPVDCEDMDLSMSALYNGYKLGELPEHLFTHMGGMTASKYLPNRLEITKANKEKFDKKWIPKLDKL